MIQESDIRLRWEDEEELALGGFYNVAEGVMDSVRRSNAAFTAEHEGEVLAYWGIREDCIIGGRASVWCLSTPAMDHHPRHAARESLMLLDSLLERYYHLSCIVDAEYVRSVRWLEWLGFQRGTKIGRLMEMHIVRGGGA